MSWPFSHIFGSPMTAVSVAGVADSAFHQEVHAAAVVVAVVAVGSMGGTAAAAVVVAGNLDEGRGTAAGTHAAGSDKEGGARLGVGGDFAVLAHSTVVAAHFLPEPIARLVFSFGALLLSPVRRVLPSSAAFLPLQLVALAKLFVAEHILLAVSVSALVVPFLEFLPFVADALPLLFHAARVPGGCALLPRVFGVQPLAAVEHVLQCAGGALLLLPSVSFPSPLLLVNDLAHLLVVPPLPLLHPPCAVPPLQLADPLVYAVPPLLLLRQPPYVAPLLP